MVGKDALYCYYKRSLHSWIAYKKFDDEINNQYEIDIFIEGIDFKIAFEDDNYLVITYIR